MNGSKSIGRGLGLAVAMGVAVAGLAWGQAPVGTAFTYQGRLRSGGAPASGAHDFRFSLWDAEANGTQIGTNKELLGLPVASGLFSTPLDFGAAAFNGDGRWLEIAVQAPGGGGYTPLVPRQPLTPTPYALYALRAAQADALDWADLVGIPDDIADGDDDHIYIAGDGLLLNGGAFAVDWAAVAPAAHDHDSRYYTQTALSTSGGGGQVHWDNLTGVPEGFADDFDNDTIYTAGSGLALTGTEFEVDFGGTGSAPTAARSDHLHDARYYTQSQLNSPGGGGQVDWSNLLAVPAGLSDGDDDTTYSAGNGLALTGTEFRVLFAGAGSALTSARSDHDHAGLYYTQTALNTSGAGGAVHWDNLAGVPAGFADGTDDGVEYTAGDGLTLTGTEFSVLFGGTGGAAAAARSDHTHLVSWYDLADVPGGFSDDDDNDTIYTAGTGLALLGGEFSVDFAGAGSALTASRSDHDHDARYVVAGQPDSIETIMLQDDAVTAAKIAPPIVSSLNSVTHDGDNIDLVPGPGIAITADDSTDTITIEATGAIGPFWSLGGNAGTSPAADFLGTTDPQPLIVRVNSAHALRLEPAATPNVIGGHEVNSVAALVKGGAIGGGGEAGAANRVTDDFGTVGGGRNNQAGDNGGTGDDKPYATIGGGAGNAATGVAATVGGGLGNQALADYATIAGGGRLDPQNPLMGNSVFDRYGTIGGGGNNRAGSDDDDATNATYATVAGGGTNFATAPGAAIGGGFVNEASGFAATVPGGDDNTAAGDYSFAAGYRAKATHNGAFVWADSIDADFASTADNQFVARATGGVKLWVDTEGSGLRLFPVKEAIEGSTANIVAGYGGNHVTANVFGGTISGGGALGANNRVTEWFGTVGGGRGNQATGVYATVGGGYTIAASGAGATVGGGRLNTASGDDSAVGGGSYNAATGRSATIAGGDENIASGDYATVGGGGGTWVGNEATHRGATVSGGIGNTASGIAATVGGGGGDMMGQGNDAIGHWSTIGGGLGNNASGDRSTVGGGGLNAATGDDATVPGGSGNTALGNYSFAAGCRAKANHAGAFVWADSSVLTADFASQQNHQFRARATGGVRFDVNNSRWVELYDDGTNLIEASNGARLTVGGAWTNSSDANRKESFAPVDSGDVLRRVVALPITTWSYKAEDPAVRHMGPVAQDFHAAFGLGSDDKTIGTLDADGVALAAIQGLHGLVRDRGIQLADMAARLEQKEGEIVELRERLARIEALIDNLAQERKGGER